MHCKADYLTTNEIKIAFTHMPKAGGRSYIEIFERTFDKRLEMNSSQLKDENKYPPEETAYFNLIAGHFTYQSFIKLPRCFKYVTVLRNPIDRVISQYNHFMSLETNITYAKQMREEDWSLIDFITTNNPNILYWVLPYMCFIAGVVDDDVFDIEDIFKRAVGNIYFNYDSVGVIERPEDTLKLFRHRYGIGGELLEIGKTPESAKHDITDEDYEVLKTRIQPEILLYEIAGGLLDEALTKEGLD